MTDSPPPDDDPSTAGDGAVRAEYDWASVPPSTAVVLTLAIASNREPAALGPLSDAIDPDALNRLVRSAGDGSSDGGLSVRFRFDGHAVAVQGTGTLLVSPL